MKMITAADLFCGGGGTSTGLVRAANARGLQISLLAINHWKTAIETHTRNHPWARHICADLASVEADPSKLIPSGKLDILVASPECTHHSIARGGRPCSDQSRASAWHVLHWAERLWIEDILIENVREFKTWGPLLSNGRPDKRRAGETFSAFIRALESLGYRVEWRVLNAADYGDATTRKRLFIRANRSGRITWPKETHAGKWRPASEVIDWSLRGKSIFGRKRPLKPRTLDRIEAGLRKFGGEPFIAILRGTHENQSGSWAKSVDEPVPTISAGGTHAGICEPFVIGQQSGAIPRSIKKPLPTISTAGAISLCQPFIVRFQGGTDAQALRTHSVDNPLPTQPTENRFGLCRPFLTKYYRTGSAMDRFDLVEPSRMDIFFRMLQPHELAAAMGFDGYQFAGTKSDQVRQIGNAVAVHIAEALCGSMMQARMGGERTKRTDGTG